MSLVRDIVRKRVNKAKVNNDSGMNIEKYSKLNKNK